jgi:hypothetical protein
MRKTIEAILIPVVIFIASTSAAAKTNEEKSAYQATKNAASADYKAARSACNSFKGNPKGACIEEARAKQTRTKAQAEATYKNTLKARINARKAIAAADYALAKTRCESQAGNARSVCIKQAKALKVATAADATADRKITEARNAARDDKREAQHKVELEKCDALAGVARESCIALAKVQFSR